MAAVAGKGRRIDVLSRPKPVPPGLQEDRRSVYWVDKRPIQVDGTTEFVLSARLADLARHKTTNTNYTGDRPTPVWPVSGPAQKAFTSSRLATLACPRPVHPDYKYERSPYTKVTPCALTGDCSSRLGALATPKPHMIWSQDEDTTYSEGHFSTPIRPVSQAATTGRCSQRIEALSESKSAPASFSLMRSVQWPVTDHAKNAVATLRLQQLARPKSGRLRKDDYDPYRVSSAARSTNPTPRVTELSLPIPRKVRQKKIG